jgi:hypothetical protein
MTLQDLIKQWKAEADAADEEKERAARQQPSTPHEKPEATTAYLVASERAYVSRRHADQLQRVLDGRTH